MKYLIFNILDGSVRALSLEKAETLIDEHFLPEHMPGTASVAREQMRGLRLGDYMRPGPFVIVAVNAVQ